MRTLNALLGVVALATVGIGCGNTPGGGGGDGGGSSDLAGGSGADMASVPGADMAYLSQCGRPGDVGNSKGVGKFCMGFGDCSGQPANICSALGNGSPPSASDTYFCTIISCDGANPPIDCGPGASCVKDPAGRGSACTPTSCQHP